MITDNTFASSVGISRPAPLETETYLLPAHWAGAFVNNDSQGLAQEDLTSIETWRARINPGKCLGVDIENAAFSWDGSDSNDDLGATRCDFFFVVH